VSVQAQPACSSIWSDTKTVPLLFANTGVPSGFSGDAKKYLQTIRGELTYHVNWGGAPIAAKY
jgi:hypothetical protein